MYERYKEIRNAKGYKDADIAKATGIAKSTLSDWKNGKSMPKTEKLKKIAEVLDVSLEELVSGNIEWNPSTQEITLRPGIRVVHKDGTVDDMDILPIVKDLEQNYYINEEVQSMAKFLVENPEYKVLFDASRKVKPEDLQKALTALGLFTEEK